MESRAISPVVKEQALYQMAADVPVHHKSPATVVFDSCVDTVLEWLESQIGEPVPRQQASRDAYEIDRTRHRVYCCSLPEKKVWSARLIYPDFVRVKDGPDVRYDWKIDVTLHRQDDGIVFSIYRACVYQPGDLERIPVKLPEVVAVMAKKHGLRAARSIDDKPWYLDQKSELRKLEECLTSSKRMLPLIVMTELDDKRDGVAQYPLDEHSLARQTFGFAHVVCLSRKLELLWADTVGRSWAAPVNAVRIYWPGLNLETGSPGSHPCFEASSSLLGMDRNDRNRIISKLVQQEASKPIHWKNWYFYSRTRFRKAALQRHRIQAEEKEKASGVLKDKESTWSVWENQYLEELDAAARHSDEQDRRLAAQDDELFIRALLLEEAKDKDRISQTTIRALQQALEDKTGVREDRTIPIPDNLFELPEWVERHLAGRLILYNKAQHDIRDSEYNNPQLIYQALLLLAGPYRNMRLGVSGEKGKWDAGLATLNLNHAPSISQEQVGRFWEKYHIRYPDENSHRLLKHHLKKGVDSEPRLCLRIYFFWDKERKIVVVGSLPKHLPTGLM